MKRNNKGFTLAELLIVVAIIAVLVAISIPIFTSQLEKSRESTDIANMRAAKAAAVTAYLTDTTTGDLYYDAGSGKLVTTKPTATYGKGTTADGGTDAYPDYTNTTAYTGKVIKVTIAANGGLTFAWE